MDRRSLLAAVCLLPAVAWGSEPMSAIITSPVPNRVFQQVSAKGAFRVQWRGAGVSLVRLKDLSGVTQYEATDGNFGNIDPAMYDAVLVSSGVEGDSIRVGVGDVLLCAGQSNCVSYLQPSNFVYPRPSGAGKVIVSDYYAHGSHAFVDTYDTDIDSSICWIACGIAMNKPYPVMFVNVGQGNTSSTQWVDSLVTRIFEAWAMYKPKAILWLQGESDYGEGVDQATYFKNLNAMIFSLRNVTVMPWVMAKNSYLPPYAPVRDAQQQLIDKDWGEPSNLVKAGPDTDQFRATNAAEFFGDELRQVGEAWALSLLGHGF